MIDALLVGKVLLLGCPIGFLIYQYWKFATAKNVSVRQGEVAIIENTLTGSLRVAERGLHVLNQFYERVAREGISVRNEPSDPKPVEVKTKNLTGVKVDLVIIKKRIVDPIKATTKINYDKLNTIIEERINVLIQKAFGKADLEDIFEDEAIDNDPNSPSPSAAAPKAKRINGAQVEKLLSSATMEINNELAQIAQNEWGMEVEVAIQNFFLPPKLQDVAEDIATEDAEAIRVRKKAKAYGIEPDELLRLDAQTQIGGLIMKALGTLNKGGKQ